MRGASTLTLLVALVLSLSLGCVTDERARQAQQNLIGAPIATVTDCLGQPQYAGEEEHGDTVVAYVVPLAGSSASDLTAAMAAGKCLLTFRLSDGVVSEVSARGRTGDGLNGDAECAILLEGCQTASIP